MKVRMVAIRRFFVAIAFFSALTASVSGQTIAAKTHANGLIVQLRSGVNVTQLAGQLGFTITRNLDSTTDGPTYVINRTSNGAGTDKALKDSLANSGSINWVDDNKVINLSLLDGGETVLPLDGGETVLPLDGGETVLPLGPGITTVTTATIQAALSSVLQTLDGGETVLPLDGGETVLPLSQIQAAYNKVASLSVGSPALILQPAFAKIGFYGAVLGSTGKGIAIADLDTGADTCHPALKGIYTNNFVANESRAPEDCPVNGTVPGPGYGHGTEVASLLSILAPQSDIWALRVFDSTGTADVATVYQATVWAVNHGIDIINMSFGANVDSQALNNAIAYAASHGVVVTGAAGNSNQNSVMYPAAIQPAMAVAATDLSDAKASFSNYNGGIDVSAPGTQLVTAYPGSRYAIVWGTSFAAPLVAADGALTAAAWGAQHSGSLSSNWLIPILQFGVDNIWSENPQYFGKLGSGRINMWKAYSIVSPPASWTEPAVRTHP